MTTRYCISNFQGIIITVLIELPLTYCSTDLQRFEKNASIWITLLKFIVGIEKQEEETCSSVFYLHIDAEVLKDFMLTPFHIIIGEELPERIRKCYFTTALFSRS